MALVFLVGWARPPATGQDSRRGPRMCWLRAPSLWPHQAAQSYRQAHPPHDGPASVRLGAEPGPPSLWARASWTRRDWGARMAALVLLRDGPKRVCALVPPSVHLCKGRPCRSLARQQPGLGPATRGQQVSCIL